MRVNNKQQSQRQNLIKSLVYDFNQFIILPLNKPTTNSNKQKYPPKKDKTL
jgi:hypothetical protein